MTAAQVTFDFPQRLSEKYRPTTIEGFIGLEIPKRVMAAFVKRPTCDAFYFVGPSGSGKTSLAKAVIDALNAEEHHIPSKSCDLLKIEETIAMCHRAPWVMFGPNAGKPCHFHCVHVSEADQMTGAAQLALLSKMDATEWPPQTFFIYTANGTHLLEPRFLSRCKVLDFAPATANLAQYLEKIYKREGGSYPIDFAKFAEITKGNVRDALGKVEAILMMASDGQSLPQTSSQKPEADHSHKCGECAVTIPCFEKNCRKQAVAKTCPIGGRPPCAGTTPDRAEKNRRAWQTRRDKNGSNGKKKGVA